MKKRIRGTTAAIETAAQRMRREPTPAEAALWEALRGNQVRGMRFRRQHPVGRFVLDFCCTSEKLVVELDGEYHDDPDQHARDDARTAQLQAYGYRILRFRNSEVLNDLPSVVARIEAELPE